MAASTAVSDHAPPLLISDPNFRPCLRFRFDNFWTKQEDFLEIVAAAWNSTPAVGSPIVTLHAKLSASANAQSGVLISEKISNFNLLLSMS